MRATHIIPLLLHSAQATNVLLPLYVYPSWQGWWNNVYTAIAANPHLLFQVILNPDNGPGSGSSPGYNSDWVTGVATLNSYPNVQTLGYVSTSWGARSASDVDADVATWAAWDSSVTSGSGNISVAGIFFDEVPNWTGSKGTSDVSYMTARSTNARSQFAAASSPPYRFQVVYNVGTQVVHSEYFGTVSSTGAGADLVVVYENYASAYNPSTVLANNVPSSSALAARSAVLIHDFVDAELSSSTVASWLDGLRGAGVGSANILDYGYDKANSADAPAAIGTVAGILSS